MFEIIFTFFPYSRSTLPEQAITAIGPIENNSTVEKNLRNASFMRAWEECLFIAEMLFGFNAFESPETNSNGINSTDNNIDNDTAISNTSSQCDKSKDEIDCLNQPQTNVVTCANTKNDTSDEADRHAAIAKSKYPIVVLKSLKAEINDSNKVAIVNSKFPMIVLRDIAPKSSQLNSNNSQKDSTLQNRSSESQIERKMTRSMKRKLEAKVADSEQPREKKSKIRK